MREWIVILEATCTTSAIDMEAVRRLVQAVAALKPGALYSAERYALQLHVEANSPAQALASALHRWHDEVTRIGDELAACALARAEVLTPEEYEFEHIAEAGGTPSSVRVVTERPLDDGEELLRRALLDSVTGLPSRELFVHHVDRALIASQRAGSHLAVLCVQVDDGPGASRGGRRASRDQIRQRLAARIAASVRPTDTAARLGENQFALVLEDACAERATTVATRLVEVLREPMTLDDGVVVVPASIGIAMSQHQKTAEELLGQATRAAAQAQQSETDRVAWFHAPDGATPIEENARRHVGPDGAAMVAVLTTVARAANDAATLEEAASVAIRQVCAHTGWPAGRLCQRDGDELQPTDVSWSSTHSDQPWARSAEAVPSASGRSAPRRATTVVQTSPEGLIGLARPSGQPLRSFSVPVLVGSEVVAALEFLVDGPVQPDDVLVESVAAVGIQLGRVVERNRTQEALRELEEGDGSAAEPS